MSLRPLILTAAAAVALAAPLAACGRLGQLEKPSALNGSGTATTRKSDEAQRQATDTQRPVDTVDPREHEVQPAPPRTLPIPGTFNPTGNAPPPGALPNPYDNPR